MSDCLRFALLVGSWPGELPDDDLRALTEHLAACPACSGRSADAAAMSGLMRGALPAEAELSGFADGVMSRLELASPPHVRETLTPVRARAAGDLLRGLRAFTARHPFAIAVLAPAAVAALLAITYLQAGWPGRRPPAVVEVWAQGKSATVLETAEGPIVLLGEDEPIGS